MEPATCADLDKPRVKSPDQLQTEFVSVVSHELRTPVSAIQGYTDLLLENAYGELQSEQREIIAYVKQSAGTLMGMIDNLLSLSLMNRGQTDLILKTFTVEEVIKDVLMTCRADYEHKKLSISNRVQPADLCIRSDRIKLQQILTNLVANAIRYTQQGWIQIDAHTTKPTGNDAPMLELCVSDSGAGISAEDQKRIFERFYRGDGSAECDRQGMGLGLYIVHSLTRMLGGAINVKSEFGKGSTFVVRLPVKFEEAKALQNLVQFNQEAKQESGSTSVSSPQERIALFLGDDPDKCRLLGENLRLEGIQVVSACDMQQVVEKVTLVKPLAIFYDPTSVGGNNGHTFQDLKSNPVTKGIPVLFFMESATGGSQTSGQAPVVATKTQASQPARPRNGSSRFRVLVTDDDAGMREVLQLALESEGYEVLLAGDGHEALALLSKERPDLMLLDLMMPGLSGWDLIDILAQKPELSATKVLMLTGASLTQEETQELRSRTGGLLKKDNLRFNNILAGVAQAIGQG